MNDSVQGEFVKTEDRATGRILCIFCKANIVFDGLPATRYEKHLYNEHNAVFEKERVIQWTLRQQIPSLADPLQCTILEHQKTPLKSEIIEIFENVIAEDEDTDDCEPTDSLIATTSLQYTDFTTGTVDHCAPLDSLSPTTLLRFTEDSSSSESLDEDSKSAIESEMIDVEDTAPESADPLLLNSALQTEDSLTFEEWKIGKSCFQCELCQWKGSELADSFRHVTKDHNVDYKTYLDEFGYLNNIQNIITCQLCGQKIEHKTNTMTAHMKGKHKISLEKYFDKFVSNQENENEEHTTSAEDNLSSVGIMPSVIAGIETTTADATNENEDFNIENYIVEEFPPAIDNNSIGEEPLAEDPDLIIGESFSSDLNKGLQLEINPSIELENQPQSTNTIPWYHGILCQCKMCGRQFFEVGDLKKHVISTHNKRLEDLTLEYGDPINANNIHECLVCGKEVPHCSTAIGGHLNLHDLSLGLYYQQYKKDIDKATVYLPITDEMLIVKLREKAQAPTTLIPGGVSLVNKQAVKPANDWLNRCIYICKICTNYTSLVYGTFIQHLARVHKMSGRKYMENNGGKLTTTVTKHICQLCGLVMDWDRQIIYMHLSYSHTSTSLCDYVQTFEKTYSENPPLEENKEDLWMNKCTFECKECTPPVTFNTRNKVIHHFYKTHKLTLKDYHQKHRTFFLQTVHHTCKVCSKSIRWDGDTITSHLHHSHSLTPVAYFMKHLNHDVKSRVAKTTVINTQSLNTTKPSSSSHSQWLNRCLYKCNLCNFETINYSSFYPHISSVHNMNADVFLEKYKNQLNHKIVKHTCQLCGFISDWGGEWINNHLRSAHGSMSLAEYLDKFEYSYKQFPEFFEKESDKWMNQCKFSCRICKNGGHFQTRATFNLHLLTIHKIDLNGVYKKHSDYYSTALDKMTCKLCEKFIKWDKASITSHLECEHKMNPDTYFKEILRGDLNSAFESVPKTRQHKSEAVVGTVEQDVNDWLNRCEYACSLCEFKVNSLERFHSHVAIVHKTCGKTYIEENRSKMCTKKVIHTCQLCGLALDWDQNSIVRHLLQKHSPITPKDYVNKYEKCYTDFPKLAEKESEEWMNQCVFECRICKESKHFTTRLDLLLHLCREHKMSLKEYLRREKNLTSKLVQHICMICEKSMRWDSDTIKAHLLTFHSTTPDIYFKDHMKDYNSKIPPPKPAIALNFTGCPLVQWNDKCRFSCQLCYKIFQGMENLNWHVSNKHRMKEDYYSEYFNTDPIDKVTHTCMVCGEETLFDSQTMKRHLQTSHNKHIDVYKSKHFDSYINSLDSNHVKSGFVVRNKYYCKICKTIWKGNKQFEDHILSKHSLNLSRYTEKNGSGFFENHQHICQFVDSSGNLCSKSMPWDEHPLTEHLLEEHKISVTQYISQYSLDYNNQAFEKAAAAERELWADKCTFTCRICFQLFKTKSSLVTHAAGIHKKQIDETFQLMDAVVNYVFHTCQMCSENIVWESGSLQNHFESKHESKVTLKDYQMQYLTSYTENEVCCMKMSEFENWMNCCIYKCNLCIGSTETMSNKMMLFQHLRIYHTGKKNTYFTKYKNSTFVQKKEHICQICAKPVLWDAYYLKHHLTQYHKMKPAIYRAKYFAGITQNDTEVLKPSSKEQPKLKSVVKATSTSQEIKNENIDKPEASALSNVILTADEAGTWARGCLYSCDICGRFFAGLRTLTEHTKSSHNTVCINKNAVVINTHFCQLCISKVMHDEIELKDHFQTQHRISIPEYYNRFKNKLCMPKFKVFEPSKLLLGTAGNTASSNPKLAVKRKAESVQSSSKKNLLSSSQTSAETTNVHQPSVAHYLQNTPLILHYSSLASFAKNIASKETIPEHKHKEPSEAVSSSSSSPRRNEPSPTTSIDPPANMSTEEVNSSSMLKGCPQSESTDVVGLFQTVTFKDEQNSSTANISPEPLQSKISKPRAIKLNRNEATFGVVAMNSYEQRSFLTKPTAVMKDLCLPSNDITVFRDPSGPCIYIYRDIQICMDAALKEVFKGEFRKHFVSHMSSSKSKQDGCSYAVHFGTKMKEEGTRNEIYSVAALKRKIWAHEKLRAIVVQYIGDFDYTLDIADVPRPFVLIPCPEKDGYKCIPEEMKTPRSSRFTRSALVKEPTKN